MKQVVAVLVSICSGVCFSAFGQNLTVDDVRSIANEVNKSLPIRMDQDIEMMNVTPMGMTLVYNARYVNYPASYFSPGVIADMKAQSKPDGIRASCSNPRIRNMLRQGIDVKYVYYASDGGYVWEWIVDENICSTTN
jgi:hypothetical protein